MRKKWQKPFVLDNNRFRAQDRTQVSTGGTSTGREGGVAGVLALLVLSILLYALGRRQRMRVEAGETAEEMAVIPANLGQGFVSSAADDVALQLVEQLCGQ